MTDNPFIQNLGETLQTLQVQKFTGLLMIKSAQGHQWSIYYLLGRKVWIQSRIHAIRRWCRHLAIHSPVFYERMTQPISQPYEQWNYKALARATKLKQFRRDHFSNIVENCLTEDLFDLLQVGSFQYSQSGQLLTYQAQSEAAANLPFVMLQPEETWQSAQTAWQVWQQNGLAKFSPDWAPVILQPKNLQAQATAESFQTLTALADGQHTLLDLSFKCQQPLLPLTKSILSHVTQKSMGFVELPDLIQHCPPQPQADTSPQNSMLCQTAPDTPHRLNKIATFAKKVSPFR
jgi:two-component system, chemotaxis family, response regulator PixG